MADNFNFKNFLFENKLGFYSKAENISETQDNTIIATPANPDYPTIEFELVGRPRPGARSFIAQYDGWKETMLDVVSDSQLEQGNVRIKGSWYNVSGRGLDKLKSELKRLGYTGVGGSEVAVPKEATNMEEALGGKNPEGDKLVLGFLKRIATRHEYSVEDAAKFVVNTIKSLGY